MSRSRNAPARGQGAAKARQMGLLLDLAPDGGGDLEGNDGDLEAELLSLIGDGGPPQGKKQGGGAPVPMADIERMAALCMKDLDEDEEGDEDLESDADLLAELNEVLEDDEEEKAVTPPQSNAAPRSAAQSPAVSGGLESRLIERIDMYQTAISNAKAAGETSKARRYDRGLKTLQSMLSSVKKGKPINEEEIPPPVATGGKASPASQPEPIREREQPAPEPAPAPPTNEKPLQDAPPVSSKPNLLVPPQKASAITPDTPLISPLTPSHPDPQHSEAKSLVLSRQREYKLAAIQAKQSGDTELAKRHYLTAKKLDTVVEALDKGESVDTKALPPPPGDAVVESPAPPPQSSSQPPTAAAAPAPAVPPVADAALPAPRNVAEALQQRMEKYKQAAEGAKSKGDDRKARMHQRIVKQYQDAIRAHKAGRPVNLSDLPVPPGCPPLQGSEGGEQNFMGVLETAMKLANQDADAEDDDGPGEEVAKPAAKPAAPRAKAAAPPPPGTASQGTNPAPSKGAKLGPKAQQQLDFLLMRRQQFVRAALRSKQMKDMQGAALHLRNAKGLDQMITAAKGGLPVDITKVPSAPVTEEDYSLAQTRSSPLSPRTSEQYTQLMDHLRQQHEKCLGYSQQFTHMGNVAETARFEKLAEECMQNIEMLKKAHAKGRPVPRFHTEERTFNGVKIFPNLTANDLVLTVVKGINLPAPPGGSPNDLDASIRFEFPFPSSEEAQRDKTSTVKNTNCPEFQEKFKLNINRGHRAFKRVVQSKGIKFEIIHKGGLFKTDKVVGTAQLKLDSLETQCEIRQLVEVLDGRKPTGGHLEVRVKIREPLGGPQLQTITEKWLVIDPIPASPPKEKMGRRGDPGPPPRKDVAVPKSKPHSDHGRNVNTGRSPPQYKLHSFKLLQHDRERIELKITEYKRNRREPPPDLLQQHREISHRMQWQAAYLERASPSLLTEYDKVLQRLVQGLSEGVKKYSGQGNREAAKDALGRMRMVESELESLRRKRAI
ncbi:coiled-coil and C2 domain-containing protein 1A [Megalops cyprinoides]|uniref:coiled-coil and C2 domain-containing protein 1A n=1 Tax=Megalops cyprinoides TaxID=118141 RepID=UPI001863C9E9|nr:coiled-coil and C2 domain-containing protein 1A [Megalops cyprinoides]